MFLVLNLGFTVVPMDGPGGVLGRLIKPLEANHFGLYSKSHPMGFTLKGSASRNRFLLRAQYIQDNSGVKSKAEKQNLKMCMNFHLVNLASYVIR